MLEEGQNTWMVEAALAPLHSYSPNRVHVRVDKRGRSIRIKAQDRSTGQYSTIAVLPAKLEGEVRKWLIEHGYLKRPRKAFWLEIS